MITGRALVERTMQDICRFGVQADGTGMEPGGGAISMDTTDFRCTIRLPKNDEVMDGSQVTVADATAIVQVSAVVSTNGGDSGADRAIQAQDIFKLTSRNDQTAVAETYRIIGDPFRGRNSALMINLKRTVGNAAL